LFCHLSLAKVIQNDVTLSKKELFTYKDACEFMGHKESPLIEEGLLELDCMGRKIQVSDFCQQKSKDPGLLRGFVDREEKKVVCQSGERVILGVLCDERDKKYCQTSENGCLQLKKIFAARLELVHHALLENKEGKKVQCYFSNDSNNDLDTPIKIKE